MAKKKFGKFVALATISGVIAAGISYFLKYKSFNNELDEDFHDFEGDDDEFDGELPHASETPTRTYVTLSEKKEEMEKAAKDAAEKAASMANDAADQMAEKARAAADDLEEKAEDMEDQAEDAMDTAADKAEDMSELLKSVVTETAEAVKKAAEASGAATATVEEEIPVTMSTTIEDDDL